MKPMKIWDDEYGDYWFTRGHVDADEFRDAILEFERLMGSPSDSLADLAARRNELKVSHFWAVDDPNDYERSIIVKEGEPGAMPYTRGIRP